MSIKRELVQVKRHMISADARLEETRSLLTMLNSTLANYALEFRSRLQNIFQINVAIFNALVALSFRYAVPKAICFNRPVTFQDAEGNFFPIHLEWINCWKVSIVIIGARIGRAHADLAQAFEHVLLIQHEGRPGRNAVENRYYRLQDASDRTKWTELEPDVPFAHAFHSGGEVVMTVMFDYEPEMGFDCPLCGTPEGTITEPSKIEWQVA